jgi:dTDP-glucose 4,6-dehydratase
MHSPRVLLVTGGAGFIGGNFIRYVFDHTPFEGTIVNFDKLTYAGNPHSLADVASQRGSRYVFVKGDIADEAAVSAVMREHNVDTVVHFAAESHVDRSIHGPGEFVNTNIVGTFTLLRAAKEYWAGRDDVRFHHVSTDEVFGSLGPTGQFTETTAYDPRSPYSASKAASDHLVSAWHHTYGLPVTMSNCSNNYGPFHFPEKLIPLMIGNLLTGKPLPVYGDGTNVRDWLYVEDHASAVWAIVTRGRNGQTYNVGGENEWTNIELVRFLCNRLADIQNKDADGYLKLITHVKDRPGHDHRYAIDCSKLKSELGWTQSVTFEQGLDLTIRWYLDHQDWVTQVTSGEYRNWIDLQYRDQSHP